ncbi:MAG: DNA alkylation repair protein [Planctomycetota bacterium]|nr:DNA alkylation repair protein [Planctomycetota bacterium]
MKVFAVMSLLKKLGSEQTRKTLVRHGAPKDIYGVKVADLKVIAKKLKGNQALALELYDTGNGDAMYLAGLVADGALMSRKQLDAWAKQADWAMVGEYTVPWVASENPQAREIALAWMDAKKEGVAAAGWNTYACHLMLQPDAELDLKEIEKLLKRVEKEIGKAPNRVRYCMNSFVIAAGGYVKPLLAKAKATAKKLGPVEVDMGDTACAVPSALGTIEKIEKMGRVGKKRKTAKC